MGHMSPPAPTSTPGRKSAAVPWYASGLRFECLRCGKCCRGEPGFVWVTRSDLARIAAYLGVDEAALLDTSVRRVGRRLSLVERPDGDCVFYRDGCTIYPVRPRQCRTFPFWPENLTSRRRWERVAEECPGTGHGRLWSRGEIELMAGKRVSDRQTTGARLRRAFRRLLVLYREVDEVLARWQSTCSACGRCCDFAAYGQELYVTELERALLESRHGQGDPMAEPGRCPYQAGGLCAVREVRPLGCRTYFCEARAAEEGRSVHELALKRMAPLREESGLELRYAPLLDERENAGEKCGFLS